MEARAVRVGDRATAVAVEAARVPDIRGLAVAVAMVLAMAPGSAMAATAATAAASEAWAEAAWAVDGAAAKEAAAMVGATKAVAAAEDVAAASAGSATRTVGVNWGKPVEEDIQDALRRRSRCSRCPERRMSTPNQGRHPHRCRCLR